MVGGAHRRWRCRARPRGEPHAWPGAGRQPGRARGRLLAATTAVAVGLTLQAAAAPAAPAAGTGGIAGTVTDAEAHTPIAGIEVCAYQRGSESSGSEPSGPEGFRCVTTGTNGEYSLSELPSGRYVVEFSAPTSGQLGYLTQYYDGASTFSGAREVTVSAPGVVAGVDAQLVKGGSISGRVTAASTAAPIGGIVVCAETNYLRAFECATTDAGGDYAITTLAAGSYTVVFTAVETGLDYITQYYDASSSRFGATSVGVTTGHATAGINAALEVGGQIAGTVTDAATGAALGGARVCAISLLPEVLECATADDVGAYEISGLPGADYEIRFSAKGYLTEYYDARYSAREAMTLPLFAGELKGGVDAALSTAPATSPSDSSAPSVTGTPTVGNPLTCSPGSWSAKPRPMLAYQWLLDGAVIEGAIESSYVPPKADVGHTLACQVTATNPLGSAGATSAAVEVAPSARELPLIAVLGRRLLAKRHEIEVELACAQARCVGRVALSARLGGARRRAQTTLAAAGFSLAAGHRRRVVLVVRGARSRAALAHAVRRPLTVRLSVTVRDGNQIVQPLRLR